MPWTETESSGGAFVYRVKCIETEHGWTIEEVQIWQDWKLISVEKAIVGTYDTEKSAISAALQAHNP